MIKYVISVLCLTLLLSLSGIAAQQIEVDVDELQTAEKPFLWLNLWHYHKGDQPNWSSTVVDDTQWGSLNLEDKNAVDAIQHTGYWLRQYITIGESPPKHSPLALYYTNLRSASELYWDGELLYRSGKIGLTLQQEQPGNVRSIVHIPTHLARAGEHLLAIRVSNHHDVTAQDPPSIAIGLYDDLLTHRYQAKSAASFIVGIFLTAVLFISLFFVGFNRKPAYLLFSLFCLVQTVKVSLVYLTSYGELTFPVYDLAIAAMHLSVYLGGLLLVAFLLDNFAIPNLRYWVLGCAAVTLVFFLLQLRVLHIALSIALAFGLSIYALTHKRKGALLSIIGLIGYSLFSVLGNLKIINFGYFVGIIFFVVCMAFSLGSRMVQQTRQHQEAILRSARLENELLKKHIQPHFIMNSLMSLQELLEDNPQQASDFIEALAEEFRGFSQMAGEKRIAIGDELALCEAHLSIMSHRKRTKFTLETEGIVGDERIPPAIFHTLIENGITHGYSQQQQGRFLLSKTATNSGVRYQLFNDGEIAVPVTSVSTATQNESDRGTGLKYVESRLQESYPDAWTLKSHAVDNGWSVTIEIHDNRVSERKAS
ncbi:sensor histidine kinase [Aliikangiella coralliicola]|uniref:Signal transduction histidine kinase internal region domain-containing protein n=1 Tax=Aliikangiella coralliicola TaxID=2592383 RepID=A0A545U8X4_9GAMM|nr:histidine kinase [Aliikangiella coralliicola]TQV85921.1 hypothetical protein FLL46_18550 [Aliikangiella coralliicola]